MITKIGMLIKTILGFIVDAFVYVAKSIIKLFKKITGWIFKAF